ncbi:hypothetical protein HKX48_001196, partial [Thoreauomyces humboldtii]
FTYDLLLKNSLYIVGEHQYHEKHCLVALPGVKLEDVTEIQSHAYVIDQCRGFLSKLPDTVAIGQAPDTASAAGRIKELNLTTSAAICGARAAEIHSLSVLVDSIEDDANTLTRYVLLSRTPLDPERHLEPRTAVAVWLKNVTGMFHRTAACFALRDIK